MPTFENLDEPTTREQQQQQHHVELMNFLRNNSSMRNTARSALKQAAWAGGATVVGGLLLGPVGGLMGGIAGSVVGFVKSNDYDGVVQQLGVLPDEQRGLLVKTVGQVLVDAGVSPSELFNDAGAFQERLVEYASRGRVREQIWKACLDVMNEEGGHVTNLTS